MATRSIVTYQPDVPCDVCGRRLLRGEQPDTFIAGGRRRTVCELCVPRATHEGWLRESDAHSASLRAPRSRSARSLLDRLRQMRAPLSPEEVEEQLPPRRRRPRERVLAPQVHEDRDLYEDVYLDSGYALGERYTLLDEAVPAEPPRSVAPAHASDAVETADDLLTGEPLDDDQLPAGLAVTSGGAKAERALQVFNGSPYADRIAGIARSLGAPCVAVRPLGESGSKVAIVVSWELCWYRYEVDLGDELAGPALVAEGMELEELPAEDREANAVADERGELSLLL